MGKRSGGRRKNRPEQNRTYKLLLDWTGPYWTRSASTSASYCNMICCCCSLTIFFSLQLSWVPPHREVAVLFKVCCPNGYLSSLFIFHIYKYNIFTSHFPPSKPYWEWKKVTQYWNYILRLSKWPTTCFTAQKVTKLRQRYEISFTNIINKCLKPFPPR